ncbi:glucosaminidase domain-containing protein [Marinicrinis sediminis]|uniref:Glucosaminidase domain-containing protein n=1 Tax=Marinicrinis sediminis TaxID=1652465 RepID=A0ABW5RCG5_9BACL
MGSRVSILGASRATADQMNAYVKKRNSLAPTLAEDYLRIGAWYGVRGDVAFAQSIKETGSWRFGGSVLPQQHNYAGLGAVSSSARGASFASPQEGIEAQIQHLYGYATTAPLPEGRKLVDPRFILLEKSNLRGTALYWNELGGKWAVPGVGYGEDIIRIWQDMLDGDLPGDPLTWKESAMNWLDEQGLITQAHDPDTAVTWAEFGVVLRRLKEQLREPKSRS